MPFVTKTYNLTKFQNGDLYSARSDFRRFSTVDYNMSSYVGIVGIGIITGWTISHIDNLDIEVSPGDGIIDGFYVESPYSIKKRSEMIAGEHEIEVVRYDDIPEADMTAGEKTIYVAIIQLYNPSFNPTGDIENAYVKVSVPYEMTLIDNSDNYIYVTRKFTESYPASNDYPSMTLTKPRESDYSIYDDYKTAYDAYEAELQAIRDYKWRDNSLNHFTEAVFNNSLIYSPSSTKVLLGKVVTRSGMVVEINTNSVTSLQNMRSTIEKFAYSMLSTHIHGGNKLFDPDKIKLETDIRQATMTQYNASSNFATFQVMESKPTEIANGHKHTYTVNSSGNGITVATIGNPPEHFHKINGFVVGSPEKTLQDVVDHAHIINTTYDSSWTTDSEYVVYVNNVEVGDELSDNIIVDVNAKTINMKGIIGGTYKTYYSSFETFGETYEFSLEETSTYRFMLQMSLDYNAKYSSRYQFDTDYDNHPFLFVIDGSIQSSNDLQQQCIVAETTLKKQGDKFLFTPSAARDIEISLLSVSVIDGLESDNVEIEILGNVEVTGTLKTENIMYINAEKITSGILEIVRLPFISHMGRINEEFLPFQYSMTSNDGVKYKVSPGRTNTSLNHFHTVSLDENGNGYTNYTYISDKPIYYAEHEGESYFIDHIHYVSKGVVSNTTSNGLTEWTNAVNNTDNNSSSHSHTVIQIVSGNSKIIYSMKEDRHGNIYAGTSDGLIVIPYDMGFLFNINGVGFTCISDSIENAFEKAKQYYEENTESILNIDDYSIQFQQASDSLSNHGDSYLFIGKSNQLEGQDDIFVKRQFYFSIPNFHGEEERLIDEINEDESIIRIKILDLITNDELNIDLEETREKIEDGLTKIVAVVRKELNNLPVLNMFIDETVANGRTNDNMTVVCTDALAMNINIQENFYATWSSLSIPSSASLIRNSVKDVNGNLWIATNDGVMISRNGNAFTFTGKTGLTKNVYDVVDDGSGQVLASTDEGIFKTLDEGGSWTQVLSTNASCLKMIRDFSSNTLYAIDELKSIYISIDNGNTWNDNGSLVDGEYSSVIVFGGKLYVGNNDGLYSRTANTWSKMLSMPIYSLSHNYGGSGLLVGSIEQMYFTDDGIRYSRIANFEGVSSAIMLRDSQRTYFDHAYNNNSTTFHMKDVIVTNQNFGALADFGGWYAENGAWTTNKYDIYLNNQILYSSYADVSNIGLVGGFVDIVKENGILNFAGQVDIATSIQVNDKNIEVPSVEFFAIGDIVKIQTNQSYGSAPTYPGTEDIDALVSYINETNTYVAQKDIIDNMVLFATIENIVDNTLILSENIEKNIEAPLTIYRIPPLNGNSSIRGNIYDSKIIGSGENTHEDIEDKLSTKNDFRPYGLNNAYLSNFLQLTQALRYVYPSINSYQKNTLYYDFHYSTNPLDPIYPYLNDYIDTLSGNIYNQSRYDIDFSRKNSGIVNAIMIGTGNFQGNIFVGTDIGLFWAKYVESIESNWFYVFELQTKINDIQIVGDNRLIVATPNGTYITEDMLSWNREKSASILFPSNCISLRWPSVSTLFIDEHEAVFSNNDDDLENIYGIIETLAVDYSVLIPGREIQIDIVGAPSSDKNGRYIVKNATATTIELTTAFATEETLTTVTMSMSRWWQRFEDETNISNPLLSNTVIVGGINRIANSNINSSLIWNGASTDLNDFSINEFLPLSSGSILAASTGNLSNNLSISRDLGEKWTIIKTFDVIHGTIGIISVDDFEHSVMNVIFTYPSDFKYGDGELCLRELYMVNKTTNAVIGTFTIIWNNLFNDVHSIWLFGRRAYDLVYDDFSTVEFRIVAPKINTMLESLNGRVLFGTNVGMMYDYSTMVNKRRIEGSIYSKGVECVVSSIDLNGRINSVSSNASNKVVLSVKLDQNIGTNELTGRNIYFIDSVMVQAFPIVFNTGNSTNAETEITLNENYSTQWAFRNGNRISIVGEKSTVYFNSSIIVNGGEFKNGKMHIVSNEAGNRWNIENISDNTSNYLILDSAIVPGDMSLIAGQKVSLVPANGCMEIKVAFTNTFIDNAFVGFNFVPLSNNGQVSTIPMKIKENSRNTIILEDFSSKLTDSQTVFSVISVADAFSLEGNMVIPLSSFDAKKTSIVDDHWHDVIMVEQIISGEIDYFADENGQIVTFTVDNVDGFDLPIVQHRYDLFKGGGIRFYNPLNINTEFFAEIVEHSMNSISVLVFNSSVWNFNQYDSGKISTGWKWEIDATRYGYAENTYYKDFVVFSTKITDSIDIGSTTVKVEDSSSISNGDRITLFRENEYSEDNVVLSIVDATSIILTNPTTKYFSIRDNLELKVLENSFTNDHEHQIRENRVESLTVMDYVNLGYPALHAHVVEPYIKNISTMAMDGNTIMVGGSGSELYGSTSSIEDWSSVVDLNDYIEDGQEVSSVSKMAMIDGSVVVGVDGGRLLIKKEASTDVVALLQPSL